MAALFGVPEVERIVAFAKKYPVFPCAQDKRPRTARGFHDASQDAAQVRDWWTRWPDSLVGVPTGQITGIVAIDYDPDKATNATHAWLAAHTDLLTSTRVHTTARGGKHYLFRSTERFQTGTDLVLDGSPRRGLDLRASGGYVIWWPAHLGGSDDTAIANLPAGLIDERRFVDKRDMAPLPSVSPETWALERDKVHLALTYLAPEGYDHWIKVGMAIHHASGGSDEGFGLWHEWSSRGDSYDGIQDCRFHWHSFGKYHGTPIGLGSLFLKAREAGYGALPVDFSTPDGAVEPEPKAPMIGARLMRWPELEGLEPPSRTWLISHWLTYGITLLSGRGGIGKSMIGQTVATALALGRTFIDDIQKPQTVLMWACEDDHDEVWRRQVAINRFFGCSMGDIDGRLVIESRVGATNSMWSMHFGALTPGPAIKEWHQQINDYRADVAILDNIAHAFGGNENDRHHVTSFVNGLASATERPLATILLGHVARSQGSEFAGSAAWENAARMRWLFDSKLPDQGKDVDDEPVDGVRYLAKRKANYSTNDYRRFTYRDGLFAPDSTGVTQSSYSSQSRKDDARRCVLSALRKIVAAGMSATSSTASAEYLPKLIVKMRLAEDYSVKELAEAMAALLIAGRLRVDVVGQYANRTPKKGLVEVQL